MIFETHAHYDDEQFDKDREELLDSMEKNGIGTIVNIGSNMETSRWTVKAADKYPFLYGAVGVHPSDTGEMKTEDLAELKKYASNPKILAIGEIGLDYYWDEPERPIQKKWFEAQMELARETKLPMVIHSRDAAKDTEDMMRAARAEEIGGVVHCFSYPKEMARKFLDMGFYLGIGGVVTFLLCTAGQNFAGDGQPLSFSGTKPGKEKFFFKSAVCGRTDCRTQRDQHKGSY